MSRQIMRVPTTSTRPVRVPKTHGITGYTAYACRCDICSDAYRTYQREWAYERRRGKRRTTDSASTRSHLEVLIKAGFSVNAVAIIVGCSNYALLKILDGRTKRPTRRIADAVLGVTLDDLPVGARVPSRRVLRLLDGIRAAGYSDNDINRMLGNQPSGLHIGRSHHCFWSTWLRVSTLYRLLAARGLVDGALVGELP